MAPEIRLQKGESDLDKGEEITVPLPSQFYAKAILFGREINFENIARNAE